MCIKLHFSSIKVDQWGRECRKDLGPQDLVAKTNL